nr:shikimate kinase [Herbinix luporum]
MLIGFMGSGKSSVGKLLSEKINYKYGDTDEIIENLEDMSIKKIFRIHGEDFFRDLETGLLLSIKDSLKKTVLSTGGGMPIFERNRELLKNMGHVVYLQASKSTIVERLSGDTTRPLLKGEKLEEKVEKLLSTRLKYYEEAADITINTDNKSIDDIAEEIIEKLGY